MTILHMETDTVRTMASQIKQAAEALRNQAQGLNSSAQSVDWLGPSRDEFVAETECIVRQLDARVDAGAVLAERVENEVAEWEVISKDLGSGNSTLLTATPQNKKSFSEYMDKYFVSNMDYSFFGVIPGGLCATVSQVSILRAFGYQISMQDIVSEPWKISQSSQFFPDEFLHDYGIGAEQWESDSQSDSQNWLIDRVQNNKGVIVSVDYPTLTGNSAGTPGYHVVIVTGINRDEHGNVVPYTCLDSNSPLQKSMIVPYVTFCLEQAVAVLATIQDDILQPILRRL